MMRSVFVAGVAVLALGACEPKPPEAPPASESAAAATATEADVETRNALLTALTPVIEYEIGGAQKLSFKVEEARTQGDWGWIHATPLTLEGAPMNWANTKAGTSAGANPAKLSLNMRPKAAAGLAKAVEAVNQ